MPFYARWMVSRASPERPGRRGLDAHVFSWSLPMAECPDAVADAVAAVLAPLGLELFDDDEPVNVAYPEIVQARTVFEWGPAPKPSKGNKARNRARQHAAERSDR